MVDHRTREDVAMLTGMDNWEVELVGGGLTGDDSAFYDERKKGLTQGPLTLGMRVRELLESEQARRNDARQGIIDILDKSSTDGLIALHRRMTEGMK